jgi:hypothetical protein
VTAVIREKAPAEIFVIKVFDRAGGDGHRAGRRMPSRASRTGRHRQSQPRPQSEHAAALSEAVAELTDSGALIVAAGEQEGVRWLPGSLDGVCSVTLDWSLDRNEIRSTGAAGRISYRASGYPRPIPGVPVERNLKGLSFAVANVTGVLAAERESSETRRQF